MKAIFEQEIAGFPIRLRQTTKNTFQVIYGKKIWNHLGYATAAQKLGEAIMHALACEGKINQ